MNLNKKSLLVSKFAGDKREEREAFKCIHITNDYCEATNGHMLIRITNPEQYKKDDLPDELSGYAGKLEKDFIITKDSVSGIKFTKINTLPALDGQIYIKDDKDNVNISSTDLSTINKVNIKKEDHKYPNMDVVFPKTKPKFRVSISPKYLETISNVAKNFTETGLVLDIYGNPKSPIVFNAKDDMSGQSMTAILMPTLDSIESENNLEVEPREIVDEFVNNIVPLHTGYNKKQEIVDTILKLLSDQECLKEQVRSCVEK